MIGGEWVWVAGGAALVLAVGAWQFLVLRGRVGKGRAAVLGVLRAVAVGLVLAAVAAPRIARSGARRVARPLAVAVDATPSMGLKGGLPETRLERVRALLASPEVAAALEGWVPEYFALGASAEKLPTGGLAALRPERPGGDLAAPLARLHEDAAAGTGAILAFTDGGRPAESPARPAVPGPPIVLVAVGAGERPRDIEIVGVDAPGIVFSGQPAPLKVRVRASGVAPRGVPVLLKRGAQVLASATAELRSAGETVEVPLTWTPPAPGTHPLTVEVPVQEGEQVVDNNRTDLALEARRDKIRVLLVSGSPSWSYRFLRGALKGDPTVDLVSFIILRSASDAVDVPQQELSLIPFPTQKIFLEELPNFDLLVFDDFAYQPYLPATYLEKVRDFVRAGGAFWMLGGPQSFLGGRYQSSPIAGVLPVALPDVTPADGGFRDVRIAPTLTGAGRRHPLFQGVADPEAPLPPLDGFNFAGNPRPGATVVAEARLPDGSVGPLVVAGRHGAGRTLAVATDSLWRWAFEEAGRGRGSGTYLGFVRQALRWSVGDPQLEPVQVEPERPRVAPGGRLRARVRVLGDDYLPAPDAPLSVTLRGPGGEARALAPVAEAPGSYVVEADVPAPGAWEIVAAAGASRRASATVTAAWPDEELSAAAPDPATVAALAAGRPSAVIELGDPAATAAAIARALEDLAPPPEARTLAARTPAEEPWFFLLFLGVVATEWILRRKSSLD